MDEYLEQYQRKTYEILQNAPLNKTFAYVDIGANIFSLIFVSSLILVIVKSKRSAWTIDRKLILLVAAFDVALCVFNIINGAFKLSTDFSFYYKPYTCNIEMFLIASLNHCSLFSSASVAFERYLIIVKKQSRSDSFYWAISGGVVFLAVGGAVFCLFDELYLSEGGLQCLMSNKTTVGIITTLVFMFEGGYTTSVLGFSYVMIAYYRYKQNNELSSMMSSSGDVEEAKRNARNASFKTFRKSMILLISYYTVLVPVICALLSCLIFGGPPVALDYLLFATLGFVPAINSIIVISFFNDIKENVYCFWSNLAKGKIVLTGN